MIRITMGIYLVVDGIASIIKFRGQPAIYQLIRLGRTAIGIILIGSGISCGS